MVVDSIEMLHQISGFRNRQSVARGEKPSFNHVSSLHGNTDHFQLCFIYFFQNHFYLVQNYNENPASVAFGVFVSYALAISQDV